MYLTLQMLIHDVIGSAAGTGPRTDSCLCASSRRGSAGIQPDRPSRRFSQRMRVNIGATTKQIDKKRSLSWNGDCLLTGEAGAPVSVAWSLACAASLFLAEFEQATQTGVVGAQRLQLARKPLLHSVQSRQRSSSAFAAVDTFITKRR